MKNETGIIDQNSILFTEESNAIDYLEKAYFLIALTRRNPINWKWVILALHGALYGFAICALHGAGRVSVVKNGKLITFDEALRKCKKPEIMESFVSNQPLCLTESQEKSIRIMKKELRNQFEHYTPKMWRIETNNLPRIAHDILDVISFLAIDTETNIHVLKEAQKINKLISDCKFILEK